VDDKVGLAFPPHSVVSARAWAHGAAWVAHRVCCWRTSSTPGPMWPRGWHAWCPCRC